MKNLLLLLIVLSSTLSLYGQGLKFNEDGKFKIVQFTDTHICPENIESEVSINLIKETIKSENPDFIIMTGDVVTGKPSKEGWNMILSTLNNTGIPFFILNGNHDTEQDLSYEEISKLIVSTKNSLNNLNKNGILADRVLEVKGKDNLSTQALLYCIDSHSNSTNKNVDGYAWIKHEQISWYIQESNKYKKANKDKPLPALAFFHIPLVEYTEAFNKKEGAYSGIRLEKECPANINSGLYSALIEQGDVMATFAGHDHDNDYIASYNGISLGYGRFSGGKTTYIDLQPGARIITLYEGRRDFTSYIRLSDGRIIDRYSNKLNPNRDVTFAVVADLHFDLLPETDQYYHIRALNNLENQFVWNIGSSIKGDTLKKLDFVAIAGDIYDKALDETHKLYKERYHKSNVKDDKNIKYPVYPGYGNHDINPVSNNKKENLKGRIKNLNYIDSVLNEKFSEGEILNYDNNSKSYSWNVDDVHFVQMHTYAGDNSYCTGNSLEWLAKDLDMYASGNNPVVYIQHYGFDKWALKWWPENKREALFDILDNYNVVGFFVGHTHSPSIEKYRGYSIFQVNNAWPDEDGNGSFAVARIKGNEFNVATCRWEDGDGNYEVISPYITKEDPTLNWMEKIDNKTKICKLSIPATHDSGATKGGKLLQTQDISLEKQLDGGIRGFDIRLKSENNKLVVYHGTACQDITWEDDVLPLYIDFLKKNPSEMLIVSVKCEGGSKEEYKDLLSKSLQNNEYKKYFVEEFSSDITLGDCRGKILFIHRNDVMDKYPGVYCYGWEDNVTCDMTIKGWNGNEATVSLQDEYQYRYAGNAPYKMATTFKNMTKAMNDSNDSDKWYISFASATAFPGDGPKDFSDKVNHGLAHEMQGINANCGIVLIDFAGSEDAKMLIKRLIESNHNRL